VIVLCPTCLVQYDDQFRLTLCPHPTFAANDGHNNHKHHPKAYLSTDPTTQRDYTAPLHKD
jgi:hypothetical protein